MLQHTHTKAKPLTQTNLRTVTKKGKGPVLVCLLTVPLDVSVSPGIYTLHYSYVLHIYSRPTP